MPVGLYIHVPFCRSRCHFCAFYLQIHREDRGRDYLASLERELRLHAAHGTLCGRTLETVYFGGGTPTALSSEQLLGILGSVRRHLNVQDRAEITIEAHPDTVTHDGLQALREAGVNRISFGAQSMDDQELLQVGRRTGGGHTVSAVELARRVGIGNINLDLIYGFPGQTLESWRTTLDEAIALAPTHISCYALTIETHTRFAVDLHRGDIREPDATLQNCMEDEAAERLTKAGLDRYEISNYARPGYACAHNLLYWTGGEYLGLGPSAQSFLNGCRFGNVDDLAAYHRALDAGQLPIQEREPLSLTQQQREAFIFGLRRTDGTRAENALMEDREWTGRLEHLLSRGLLEKRDGRLRLTPLGIRFADTVAVELF
jgi:oxygen-independent coproporphyrinogen-3 oxidase